MKKRLRQRLSFWEVANITCDGLRLGYSQFPSQHSICVIFFTPFTHLLWREIIQLPNTEAIVMDSLQVDL